METETQTPGTEQRVAGRSLAATQPQSSARFGRAGQFGELVERPTHALDPKRTYI